MPVARMAEGPDRQDAAYRHPRRHRCAPRGEQHVHDRTRPRRDSGHVTLIDGRSIPACSTAIGFGCRKKGCAVWCGDERKTTRRAYVARRSTTAGAVAGGTVQTRKTALTPRRPASSDPGTVRSPVTTSTHPGSPAAASGRCVRARTGTPASINWSTTMRPTRPVAPVASATPVVPAQRAPFGSTRLDEPPFTRWLRQR
jgi:hypothetical protein